MVPRLMASRLGLGLLALGGFCTAAVFHGVAVAPNTNHAWVVMSDTQGAYHTADLGKSWEYQRTDVYRVLYDAFFLDSLNGWACGGGGLIRHTTDGGDTWIRQNMSGPFYSYRIRFANDSIGWATGDWATALYTKNAGNEWHLVVLPYPAFPEDSVDFQGLDFQGPDTMWMVAGKPPENDTEHTHGDGFIARTTGTGDSWTRVYRDTVWDFYDVACIDARNICVVGGNDQTGQGTVLRTTDAGATWYPVTIVPSAGYLRSMKFVGETYGWACGDSGTIINTTDSGLTWNRQATPTCSTLFDIDFADQQRGMASGAGVVLATTNGGLTWLNATPIGVAEPKPPAPQESRPWPTVARSADWKNVTGDGTVFDATGRRVTRPTPGVCFVMVNGVRNTTHVRKVVLTK